MGSALIGATTTPPARGGLLVDNEPDNVVTLQERMNRLGRTAFRVSEGDCNIVIPRAIEHLENRFLPAFCLLDPFATELRWNTVEFLARRRLRGTPYEQLIYFPTSTVARIGAVTARGQREVHEAELDELFGTRGWEDIARRQRTKTLRPGEAGQLYLQLYEDRLQALGYAKPLSRPSLRASGGLVYHLIYVTAEPKGTKVMRLGMDRAYASTLPLQF